MDDRDFETVQLPEDDAVILKAFKAVDGTPGVLLTIPGGVQDHPLPVKNAAWLALRLYRGSQAALAGIAEDWGGTDYQVTTFEAADGSFACRMTIPAASLFIEMDAGPAGRLACRMLAAAWADLGIPGGLDPESEPVKAAFETSDARFAGPVFAWLEGQILKARGDASGL